MERAGDFPGRLYRGGFPAVSGCFAEGSVFHADGKGYERGGTECDGSRQRDEREA